MRHYRADKTPLSIVAEKISYSIRSETNRSLVIVVCIPAVTMVMGRWRPQNDPCPKAGGRGMAMCESLGNETTCEGQAYLPMAATKNLQHQE